MERWCSCKIVFVESWSFERKGSSFSLLYVRAVSEQVSHRVTCQCKCVLQCQWQYFDFNFVISGWEARLGSLHIALFVKSRGEMSLTKLDNCLENACNWQPKFTVSECQHVKDVSQCQWVLFWFHVCQIGRERKWEVEESETKWGQLAIFQLMSRKKLHS